MSLLRNTACFCGELLTGDAKLLISHFLDEDLLHWDAGQRIFEVLAQAFKLISEFEDQDDFDKPFTNCTASATRHCCSLQMWPGLPTVILCLTGRRA